MKKINNKFNQLIIKASTALRNKLKDTSGSFFTEHALTIVITVAVAGVVLAAIFGLFKDTLIPNLTAKITEFFNYKG